MRTSKMLSSQVQYSAVHQMVLQKQDTPLPLTLSMEGAVRYCTLFINRQRSQVCFRGVHFQESVFVPSVCTISSCVPLHLIK